MNTNGNLSFQYNTAEKIPETFESQKDRVILVYSNSSEIKASEITSCVALEDLLLWSQGASGVLNILQQLPDWKIISCFFGSQLVPQTLASWYHVDIVFHCAIIQFHQPSFTGRVVFCKNNCILGKKSLVGLYLSLDISASSKPIHIIKMFIV